VHRGSISALWCGVPGWMPSKTPPCFKARSSRLQLMHFGLLLTRMKTGRPRHSTIRFKPPALLPKPSSILR
jgi:hypothetical protein